MIDIVNNLLGYFCFVLAIVLYPISCLKELFEKISILRKGMNCFKKKEDEVTSFITVSAEPNYFSVNPHSRSSIDPNWSRKVRDEEITSFLEYIVENDTGNDTDED